MMMDQQSSLEIRRIIPKRMPIQKKKRTFRCGFVLFGILGFLVLVCQLVTFLTVVPKLMKHDTKSIQREIKYTNTLLRQQQQQQLQLQQHPPHLKNGRTDDHKNARSTTTTTSSRDDDKNTPANHFNHPQQQYQQQSLDPRVGSLMELAHISVTKDLIHQLPQWQDIHNIYDMMDGPKIVGLETCPVFMDKWRHSKDVYIAPAGLFDTGTNMLARLLRRNCIFQNNEDEDQPARAMHFQVPWGKHNPPTTFRLHHTCQQDILQHIQLPQERVLPVVMIKDPYTWMSSICRHKYVTDWPHTKQHCPNLQPDKTDVLLFSEDQGVTPNEPIPVHVPFSDQYSAKYSSMTDMWNDWNNEYLHTDSKGGLPFPRVMIRYEDLLYHPVQVITKLCACLEGKTRDNFVLISEPAGVNDVGHEGANGYKDAFLRYSDPLQRLGNYHTQDLDFAKQTLDPDLMTLFGYKHPQMSLIHKHVHSHEEYTGPLPL